MLRSLSLENENENKRRKIVMMQRRRSNSNNSSSLKSTLNLRLALLTKSSPARPAAGHLLFALSYLLVSLNQLLPVGVDSAQANAMSPSMRAQLAAAAAAAANSAPALALAGRGVGGLEQTASPVTLSPAAVAGGSGGSMGMLSSALGSGSVASSSSSSSGGAQLFQSPAALAAVAAAAAASQAATAPTLNIPSSPALLPGLVSQQQQQQQQQSFEQECSSSGGFISFELITGYVLSAPAESMLMQPGTLQLTDCLNICHQNSSCLAINFETGLCVLLQESADKNPQALQKSQFPVFTIYAHKICLQGERTNRCHKSWSFERVIGWVLNKLEKKTILTKTRLECLQACYNEPSFQCKSFNYDSASGSCQLSDMDRHSLASAAQRRRHYVESTVDTIDYGENNCAQEARGICDFKPLQNRILKTVDSIYQDIKSEPECRKRCLQAPYRCHSYDLGDSSNPVCRTSHLDRNSLQQIQDPYLEIQGAITYELESCYNVTVVCKSREMVARVKTNRVFNGKIYAKNAPLSCVNDISNSMDFELTMAFNDACAINRSPANGVFSNEIVLQHNDMIVTNSDMGLNVKCQYDLRNQTVYNNINLDDFMSGREPIDIASQSAVVRSPNISMQILRHDGNHITQAQVGDPLLLRFAITDDRSPFEIFVRDLYAMDGNGGTEIMLIDGEGCPTDPSIMAAMGNAKGNGQTLEAQFDAFKFPTSETVAFRALVTPCIPHCEPVHCQNRVFDGTLYEAESYGKKKRRKRSAIVNNNNNNKLIDGVAASKQSPAPEEVVVRNSIEIKDKFFLNEDEQADEMDSRQMENNNNKLNRRTAYELEQLSGGGASSAMVAPASGQQSNLKLASNAAYLKLGGMAFLFCALLVAQSALFVGWTVMSRRRRSISSQSRAAAATLFGGSSSSLHEATTKATAGSLTSGATTATGFFSSSTSSNRQAPSVVMSHKQHEKQQQLNHQHHNHQHHHHQQQQLHQNLSSVNLAASAGAAARMLSSAGSSSTSSSTLCLSSSPTSSKLLEEGGGAAFASSSSSSSSSASPSLSASSCTRESLSRRAQMFAQVDESRHHHHHHQHHQQQHHQHN